MNARLWIDDDDRPADIAPDEFSRALGVMTWFLAFCVFQGFVIRWAVDQASLSWAWIAAGL